MGFGDMFTSQSSAEDSRMAGTDRAKVIRSGGSAAVTDAGDIQAGYSAKISGLNNTNLAGARIDSSLKVKDVRGDVILGDTRAMKDLSMSFASTLERLNDRNQTAIANALSANSATVDRALSKVSELAVSDATGGASTAGKTMIYLVLGGLAILGATFYFLKGK